MEKAHASETPQQTAHRRVADREQRKDARASETPQQTAHRRVADREQRKDARASETPEQTAHRRVANREQMNDARASETPEQTAHRRVANREQMKDARASENPEQTAHRRVANREQMKDARASETPEQTAHRRVANRDQMKDARASETPEQTALRRVANRGQMKGARASETPLQTAHRRMSQNHHYANVRATAGALPISITQATAKFQEAIKEGPIYACVCCHRLMYDKSVQHYSQEKYPTAPKDLLPRISEHSQHLLTHEMQWICITCHSTLKKGQMPVQCCCNGLILDDIPPELQNLRPLELRLISQRIAFMKLVGLPKGRQVGIHGPAVNVPTNLQHVCGMLLRLPHEAEIIPVKLKRRLIYKGHHMYEYVRPQKVLDALSWLKENNTFYEGIQICDNWEDVWKEADEDLWAALMEVEQEQSSDTCSQPQSTTSVTENTTTTRSKTAPTPVTTQTTPRTRTSADSTARSASAIRSTATTATAPRTRSRTSKTRQSTASTTKSAAATTRSTVTRTGECTFTSFLFVSKVHIHFQSVYISAFCWMKGLSQKGRDKHRGVFIITP